MPKRSGEMSSRRLPIWSRRTCYRMATMDTPFTKLADTLASILESEPDGISELDLIRLDPQYRLLFGAAVILIIPFLLLRLTDKQFPFFATGAGKK